MSATSRGCPLPPAAGSSTASIISSVVCQPTTTSLHLLVSPAGSLSSLLRRASAAIMSARPAPQQRFFKTPWSIIVAVSCFRCQPMPTTSPAPPTISQCCENLLVALSRGSQRNLLVETLHRQRLSQSRRPLKSNFESQKYRQQSAPPTTGGREDEDRTGATGGTRSRREQSVNRRPSIAAATTGTFQSAAVAALFPPPAAAPRRNRKSSAVQAPATGGRRSVVVARRGMQWSKTHRSHGSCGGRATRSRRTSCCTWRDGTRQQRMRGADWRDKKGTWGGGHGAEVM